MHLTAMFSETDLQAQIDALMVKASPDPTGRLTILNYTRRAQFNPELWNHVTNQCRGLIIDANRNVIARPFEKFWNLNDPNHAETLIENLPPSAPVLTRKMDGSLGIGYQLDGRWHVATRGSFTSDQAIWATEWLRTNSPSAWPAGYTPLFEIVYPDNQIVVRYDFSGLVLLTLVHIESGEELAYADLMRHAAANAIPVVEAFDRPLAECIAEDVRNEEGYVAAWPRPGRTPLRVKIKYANYMRLHRLLTQTNAVTVWEMLRDGLDVSELTNDVPAEFRAWIDAMVQRFRKGNEAIENAARAAIQVFPGDAHLADAEHKKEFALYVLAGYKDISAVIFAMAASKKYDAIVWKMIRPRGDEERTFKVDE